MNAEDRNSAAPLTDSNEITYINDSLPAADCGTGAAAIFSGGKGSGAEGESSADRGTEAALFSEDKRLGAARESSADRGTETAALFSDGCGNGFGDRTFYINSNLFADDCRAEIASELHMQRYEYHMPLQVCARRLGVTPLQIEQLETTYTPQVDFYLAVRMARLFGCKFRIELEIDQDCLEVSAGEEDGSWQTENGEENGSREAENVVAERKEDWRAEGTAENGGRSSANAGSVGNRDWNGGRAAVDNESWRGGCPDGADRVPTTRPYILPRSLFHVDNLYSLSYELYEARNLHKMSLSDAAEQSGLTLEEIDALESGIGDINFTQAARLLDLYNRRLDLFPECFPGLPAEYYRAYFKRGSHDQAV